MAREATLDVRVSAEQKDVIRQAAALREQTMSEFILSTVIPVARSLVQRQQSIALSETAWQEFVRMVEADTPATPLARREAAAFLEEMAEQQAANARK